MSEINRDDLRADWVEHPYAGVARKLVEAHLQSAISSLHGACSVSTDPKVRGAFDKMRAIEQVLGIISNAKE